MDPNIYGIAGLPDYDDVLSMDEKKQSTVRSTIHSQMAQNQPGLDGQTSQKYQLAKDAKQVLFNKDLKREYDLFYRLHRQSGNNIETCHTEAMEAVRKKIRRQESWEEKKTEIRKENQEGTQGACIGSDEKGNRILLSMSFEGASTQKEHIARLFQYALKDEPLLSLLKGLNQEGAKLLLDNLPLDSAVFFASFPSIEYEDGDDQEKNFLTAKQKIIDAINLIVTDTLKILESFFKKLESFVNFQTVKYTLNPQIKNLVRIKEGVYFKILIHPSDMQPFILSIVLSEHKITHFYNEKENEFYIESSIENCQRLEKNELHIKFSFRDLNESLKGETPFIKKFLIEMFRVKPLTERTTQQIISFCKFRFTTLHTALDILEPRILYQFICDSHDNPDVFFKNVIEHVIKVEEDIEPVLWSYMKSRQHFFPDKDRILKSLEKYEVLKRFFEKEIFSVFEIDRYLGHKYEILIQEISTDQLEKCSSKEEVDTHTEMLLARLKKIEDRWQISYSMLKQLFEAKRKAIKEAQHNRYIALNKKEEQKADAPDIKEEYAQRRAALLEKIQQIPLDKFESCSSEGEVIILNTRLIEIYNKIVSECKAALGVNFDNALVEILDDKRHEINTAGMARLVAIKATQQRQAIPIPDGNKQEEEELRQKELDQLLSGLEEISEDFTSCGSKKEADDLVQLLVSQLIRMKKDLEKYLNREISIKLQQKEKKILAEYSRCLSIIENAEAKKVQKSLDDIQQIRVDGFTLWNSSIEEIDTWATFLRAQLDEIEKLHKHSVNSALHTALTEKRREISTAASRYISALQKRAVSTKQPLLEVKEIKPQSLRERLTYLANGGAVTNKRVLYVMAVYVTVEQIINDASRTLQAPGSKKTSPHYRIPTQEIPKSIAEILDIIAQGVKFIENALPNRETFTNWDRMQVEQELNTITEIVNNECNRWSLFKKKDEVYFSLQSILAPKR